MFFLPLHPLSYKLKEKICFASGENSYPYPLCFPIRVGRLRYVHLAAHIEVRAVLTARQKESYDSLRGYGRDK